MQRYESFKTEFVHTYDKSNENHEAVFRSLFELVHDESIKQQADETMRTVAWKDMGFQNHDPRTDFRAGGLLSLLSFFYLVRY